MGSIPSLHHHAGPRNAPHPPDEDIQRPHRQGHLQPRRQSPRQCHHSHHQRPAASRQSQDGCPEPHRFQAAGKWKVGDRVGSVVHGGMYPDEGAFAEYAKIDHDLAWPIPDDISDADATTYGVSAMTAMFALNSRLGLPFPGSKENTKPAAGDIIFIYAGATSAGLFHLQAAKAAGYTVVTTASPRSFELVKKFGADDVFDYRSPTVVKDILAKYPNLTKAVDCFSEGVSSSICAQVLKPK